ncbi:MAG: alpha/beta hydrolase [Synergistaceae bacterium]|nr:alpha/beta hydrolase [Synergistaceae bacterium]
MDFAVNEGYTNIILAGHSLGANKVIHYLSGHHDVKRVSRFLFLSPANLEWLMDGVTEREKRLGHTYQRK